LISEATHLVWKIRYDWKIGQGCDPSKKITNQEIRNHWAKAMCKRVRFDVLLADRRKFKRKALKYSLVQRTWAPIIADIDRLPYMRSSEIMQFLVGVDSGRPPG